MASSSWTSFGLLGYFDSGSEETRDADILISSQRKGVA